jgi:hypothetical protein
MSVVMLKVNMLYVVAPSFEVDKQLSGRLWVCKPSVNFTKKIVILMFQTNSLHRLECLLLAILYSLVQYLWVRPEAVFLVCETLL